MPSISPTSALLKVLRDQRNLWDAPFPWGVGYSGGLDSGVLLWALVQVVGAKNLVALYVDHGWRPEAERDAESILVDSWASACGVSLRKFPPPFPVVRTEDGARAHRFGCFREFSRENPQSLVFLAHHADDQAETILMRILRGRSWLGLKGMVSRRGFFVRPLLEIRQSLLRAVSMEQNIPFHQDSTNQDLHPDRNFLRNRLLPLAVERFPRAVKALNDLGSVWSQAIRSTVSDPGWVQSDGCGRLDGLIWDGWSPLERQNQLLAIAGNVDPQLKLSRRFLELASQDGRTAPVNGNVWSWSRTMQVICWERVVQRAVKEYFVEVPEGSWCDLGAYRFMWAGSRLTEDKSSLEVRSVDPATPFQWRSAVPGMRFSSADDQDWGKEKRRRRLGDLSPGRCALVFQGGALRAVVDPSGNRVVWAESGDGKLNNYRIFVTLVLRSDYERR